MPNADRLPDRYFAAMRASDKTAVLELFAEDAIVILPDGIERKGTAALDEMFSGIFSQSRPAPSPGPLVGSGNYWAVEVETHLPDGQKRTTANFFLTNESGLITRMHSYRRG